MLKLIALLALAVLPVRAEVPSGSGERPPSGDGASQSAEGERQAGRE